MRFFASYEHNRDGEYLWFIPLPKSDLFQDISMSIILAAMILMSLDDLTWSGLTALASTPFIACYFVFSLIESRADRKARHEDPSVRARRP